MFAGTMIDELIEKVERAENHAREEQKPAFMPEFPVYQQQNNWPSPGLQSWVSEAN